MDVMTGGNGTDGPTDEIVIVVVALQGPVPRLLVAFTNQLYVLPLASDPGGVIAHVPVPLPQPAAAGVTVMPTATPAVFCTSR